MVPAADSPQAPLALIREPVTIHFGLDMVDSRTDVVLAWGPTSTISRLAKHLNEVYPDRRTAPDSETLMRELPRHLNEAGC